MASFQDNLGKLITECQTIIRTASAFTLLQQDWDDGGGSGHNQS